MFDPEFPYDGQWWLPNAEDRKIGGRLDNSDQDGPTLTLLGSFDENPDGRNSIPRPIVLGNAHGMSRITLLNCTGAGSYGGLKGHVHKVEYHTPLVLLGQHFLNESAVKFANYSVRMRHLNEWADLRAIKHTLRGPRTVEIDESVKPIRLVDCDTFTLDVYASVSEKPDFYSNELIQTTYLSYWFKENTSLTDFWLILRDTQNLLTLLVGEPVYPVHPSAVMPGEEFRPVTIVRHVAPTESAKRLHPGDIYLPLAKMGGGTTERILQWFKKAEILRPIHNLAFGTVYHESLYAEARFLSIVQALESYHRRMKCGADLPQDEHKQRLDEIINTAPEKHRNWLRWKLGHSNDPSLENRLQSLCDQFPRFKKYLNDRTPGFISRVARTRHYLTHFDEKNREGSFAPHEVYIPSEKLRALFWMCMLTEMGYTNEEAEKVGLDSRYFRMIIQYN